MTSTRCTRREFLCAATGAAATLASRSALGRKKASSPPNVLIIQPDQHCGTIMGCAGDNQVITPNLDRLASDGIHFRRCVSASPVCSPFRGTLQTGLYPHKHGVTRNNIQLDPDLTCFAEVFGAGGYATGFIGKWHLDGGLPKKEGGTGLTPKSVGGFVPKARRRGWQEWLGYEKAHEFFEVWKYNDQAEKGRVEGYDWEPTWHTDMALDFIERNTEKNKPWLYYLAYGPPHKPEQCPERFLKLYDPEALELPPDIENDLSDERKAILRKTWQAYYAQISAIDWEIGRLVAGLKDLGIDDNTVILYTSDHGDRLGSHWGEGDKARGKSAPYARAFRIPLIVKWPERIRGNQTCDALVSSVDLTPTILDLAGLPSIEGMQGDSMVPWCVGDRGPEKEGVWIGLNNWRAIWDGRYIYSPLPPFRHLYDHQEDPHEMRNLIDSPEHRPLRERLHQKLLDLSKSIEDPLFSSLRDH